jgi:hypothetical protein
VQTAQYGYLLQASSVHGVFLSNVFAADLCPVPVLQPRQVFGAGSPQQPAIGAAKIARQRQRQRQKFTP